MLARAISLYSILAISGINVIGQQRVGIGTITPVTTLNLIGPGMNPTIPGSTSTGIFRIGISALEGIDIGKMGDFPFAGWIQSGYNGFAPDPLSLQPSGGNLGIGTTNPTSKLHIVGALKIVDGTHGAGKILTSDASGLASWQPPPPAPPTYYSSITICCQSWMTKDLNVSTYRNGDVIPKVTTNAEWAALTTGAYCYYNNDSTTYAAVYGKLYNWYAVNDPRGLAPEGWHTPSEIEWTTLSNCLGGDDVAGGPLKEMGTTHWTTPNTGANNLSSFLCLPGGARNPGGGFVLIGESSHHWSSEFASTTSRIRSIYYNSGALSLGIFSKNYGYSVRCIKD